MEKMVAESGQMPPSQVLLGAARSEQVELVEWLGAYFRTLSDLEELPESEHSRFEEKVGAGFRAWRQGLLTGRDISALRASLGWVLASTATHLGHILHRPYGYAGDFEMIDRLHTHAVSSQPGAASWDRWLQKQPAAQAVRNRKTYFHSMLDRAVKRGGPLRVLKLVSGPGRAMFEWLNRMPRDVDVRFDCVDFDPMAVAYSRRLNKEHLHRIRHFQRNVFLFRPQEDYDLIWSEGLFDYFDDAVFVKVVRRFLSRLAPGGQLIIGNFSTANPTRPTMEFLVDWILHHRTATQLRRLAREAGADPEAVSIDMEPQGVNLFVRVVRPA